MGHINRKTVAHLLDTFDEVSASVLAAMGYLCTESGRMDYRAYERLGLNVSTPVGFDYLCPNNSCRGQLNVVSVVDVLGTVYSEPAIIAQGWLTCATDARHFGRTIIYPTTVSSMMEDYATGTRRAYEMLGD